MKMMSKILLVFTLILSLVSCATVETEYSLYRENGKYGLINEKREIVLSAEYDEIQENEVYLCKSEEKGNYVYSETLEVLHKFEDGQHSIIMCSPVVKAKENQWFILDREFNKHILPEDYEVESYFYSNGLLLVSKTENKEKLYGFVDKECNLVIPFEFSYAESFVGKYAIVEKDGKEAVIDKKGKIYYCEDFK